MSTFRVFRAVFGVVLCIAASAAPSSAASPSEDRLPDPDFDYIAWDMHRYSRTYEEALRDAEYLKDLGFTHSFMSRFLMPQNNRPEQDREFIKAFGEVDLLAGIKPTLDQRGSRVAAVTGVPKPELMERGWIYTRSEGKDGGLNLLHPEIIRSYTEFFGDSVAELAEDDPRGVLRLFLMGTERKWRPPSKEAWESNRVAVQHIVDAAVADGVMEPGQAYDPEDPDFWHWWDDPFGHGKCYQLRKAVEDRILEIIPDADFMVDPLYAVKIVHGFGATWSYISNDPKWIGHGAAAIEARTWPADSAQSTQLIRGAFHDSVLEGNLLSLCLGVDKLYHWGLHFIEPGWSPDRALTSAARAEADAREFTDRRERMQFQEAYINDPENRQPLVDKHVSKRSHAEPALRTTGRLLRDRGEMFRDWHAAGPRVAVVTADPGDVPAVVLMAAGIPFDVLTRAEHVREKIDEYPCVIVTETALTREAREAVDQYADRGGPVVVVQEAPNPKVTAEPRRPFKNQVVWEPFIENERVDGVKVRGFKRFNIVARRLDSPDLDDVLAEKGQVIQQLVAETGFRAYAESRRPDVVMRSYDYQDQRVLFVVNDKRVVAEGDDDDDDVEADEEGGGDAPEARRDRRIANQGVSNEIDLLIRDPAARIRVINIDTGEEVPVTREGDGWRLRDTIEPAWYRLYAVLEDAEQWQGPGPLAPAPAVVAVQAAAGQAAGVKLTWELPFDNWVGCDVQWYRIYRADADGQPKLIDDIYARPVLGDGGILTEYVDQTAEAGAAYTYQVQAVTPLRRPGPMSEPASTGLARREIH